MVPRTDFMMECFRPRFLCSLFAPDTHCCALVSPERDIASTFQFSCVSPLVVFLLATHVASLAFDATAARGVQQFKGATRFHVPPLRKQYPALIPCNLFPKRGCSSKGITPFLPLHICFSPGEHEILLISQRLYSRPGGSRRRKEAECSTNQQKAESTSAAAGSLCVWLSSRFLLRCRRVRRVRVARRGCRHSQL